MTDKNKDPWEGLATSADVFNATAAMVVTIMLGLIIGFTFLM